MPDYSISPCIRLVTPDDSYNYRFPLQSGIEQRDKSLFGAPIFSPSPGLSKWNTDTVYIQIYVEGFIGRYLKTSPINEAISILKSFIGLSLGTRLMKLERRKLLSVLGPLPPQKRDLIVHRKMDEEWQIWSTFELQADLTESINKLGIYDFEGRLKPEMVTDYVKNRLPIISTAFIYPDKAEQVLLAS